MNKDNSPSEKTQPFKSMATIHRWKYSALAAAALASVALYAPNAFALALGAVTVQSALGEPLRAEIELPSITPAEAESLKVSTAPAETFRAQGMEYSGAVAQIQVALEKGAGGRSFLRVSSGRPVNEPFVDLIIDATWATGRITRSYTMLFDPPASRRPAPAIAAAPQLGSPATSAPVRSNPLPAARSTPAAAALRPSPAAVAGDAPSPGNVTVKAGDTAGRIANANKPQGVSLDQMLVALLRANPDAFIDGNVNLVKAGAVLQLPDADQAGATSAADARKTIAAQSRDFNSFRRKLAAAASSAPAPSETVSRTDSGKVQTVVQEDSATSTSPDKLTLSKGAVTGTQATPEALAKRKQSSAASARVDELAKNISELNKLADASTADTASTPSTPSIASTSPAAPGMPAGNAGASATAGSPTSPATSSGSPPVAPATTAAAPGIVVADANPVATPAASSQNGSSLAPVGSAPETSTPASTSSESAPALNSSTAAGAAADPGAATTPETAASSTTTPAAPPTASPAAPTAAPVTPTAAPAAPTVEPSMIDSMLEDPVIPGIVLVLLLLLGYGGYRYSQSRRNTGNLDSSFFESRLQPDSFFGSSGGQQVDTTGDSSGNSGSSLAFSHSQLDAGGDVDPVAEADVYLAYGRDLQAEEILKEAVRINPDRLSVYTKLADIYARRKDAKGLETQAREILRITDGDGADWTKVCELGKELDPANSLYLPPQPPQAMPQFTEPSGFSSDFGESEGPLSVPADLDFNLDLPDSPAPAPAQTPAAARSPASASLGTVAPAALAPAVADQHAAPDAVTDSSSAAVDTQAPIFKPAPAWTPPSAAASTAPAEQRPVAAPSAPDTRSLDFTTSQLGSSDTEPATFSSGSSDTFVPSNSGMLEFDLDSISLDLQPTPQPTASRSDQLPTEIIPLQDGPLTTKLALAREFSAIGDSDGARTLLEEIVAESSGDVQAQARQLLEALN